MNTATVIADEEAAALFAPLQRCDVVLLAVSGGADSTALMHLVARWSRGRRAGPAVHVATVDHGLRPGSRHEAETVAAAARDLGLPHHLLSWSGPKPATGRQAAARSARYDLMTALLLRLGGRDAALVTAHTADDQAETLVMRLARGSGVDGLSAMAQRRPLAADGSMVLVRPLLAVPKSRLVATLQARGIGWIDDPSNHDPAFERVRLRAEEAAMTAAGLDAKALAMSAGRLRRARHALDWATSEFEGRVLDTNGGAFAAIDRGAFAAAPQELRLRLLARVLGRFGGTAPPARLMRLEGLIERLEATTALTVTLGGCVVVATSSGLRIFRELGRLGLPECAISVGAEVRWDERFLVRAEGEGQSRQLCVRALGLPAYATLRARLDQPLPARAAATLPALWCGGQLLAVPSLAQAPGAQKATSGLRLRTDFLGLPEEAHISD